MSSCDPCITPQSRITRAGGLDKKKKKKKSRGCSDEDQQLIAVREMRAHYRIYPVYVISETWFGSAYVATRLYSANMFTPGDRRGAKEILRFFRRPITEFCIRELAIPHRTPIIVRKLRRFFSTLGRRLLRFFFNFLFGSFTEKQISRIYISSSNDSSLHRAYFWILA